MWVVTECHQVVSFEEEGSRLTLEPVKDRVVSLVFNEVFGTRIQIPESNKFKGYIGTNDQYKHELCKYLKDHLRIISAGGSTNRAGKFCRLNFVIETTEYRISDIQYVL